MYNRLLNFIKKHCVFTGNQFGFRENKNTVSAVQLLVNEILKAYQQKHLIVGIFLDI